MGPGVQLRGRPVSPASEGRVEHHWVTLGGRRSLPTGWKRPIFPRPWRQAPPEAIECQPDQNYWQDFSYLRWLPSCPTMLPGRAWELGVRSVGGLMLEHGAMGWAGRQASQCPGCQVRTGHPTGLSTERWPWLWLGAGLDARTVCPQCECSGVRRAPQSRTEALSQLLLPFAVLGEPFGTSVCPSERQQ